MLLALPTKVAQRTLVEDNLLTIGTLAARESHYLVKERRGTSNPKRETPKGQMTQREPERKSFLLPLYTRGSLSGTGVRRLRVFLWEIGELKSSLLLALLDALL